VRGDFIVDPLFTLGKSDERLPMDCIRCVTVLPKSLGLLPDWEGRLRVLKETGYNMIHFTPVQVSAQQFTLKLLVKSMASVHTCVNNFKNNFDFCFKSSWMVLCF
jgi:hypothetical protein